MPSRALLPGLTGRVVLITGASRGLGLEMALDLAAQGAALAITGSRDTPALDTAARTLRETGAEVLALAGDVADAGEAARLVAETQARFGRIDALVNNAGLGMRLISETFTSQPALFWKTDPAAWARIVATNLNGAFHMAAAVTPGMIAQRFGKIVNISSTSGMVGSSTSCAYSATKFAVRGMTKSAALELGPLGIRVNSVHPGNVDTDMSRAGLTPEIIQGMATRIPLRRQGQPGEVAELILWLASDASSFCTGSEFVVDGGLIAG